MLEVVSPSLLLFWDDRWISFCQTNLHICLLYRISFWFVYGLQEYPFLFSFFSWAPWYLGSSIDTLCSEKRRAVIVSMKR